MKYRLLLCGFMHLVLFQSSTCNSSYQKFSPVENTEQQWWNELNETWQELFLRESAHLNEKITQEILEEILLLERISTDHYPLGETGLDPLKKLVHLKEISAANTHISQIKAVESLPELEYLDITGTSVTDLSPLTNHHKMTSLYLQQTPITDISPLSNLINLQIINLNQTKITSIKALFELNKLAILVLSQTDIPEDEIQDFAKSHPNCEIIH